MITAERDQPEIDFAVPMIDIDPPPRATPRASRGRDRPGVCPTPGITAVAAAPGAAIKVMPRVGPTSPLARATVLLTRPEEMTLSWARSNFS